MSLFNVSARRNTSLASLTLLLNMPSSLARVEEGVVSRVWHESCFLLKSRLIITYYLNDYD